MVVRVRKAPTKCQTLNWVIPPQPCSIYEEAVRNLLHKSYDKDLNPGPSGHDRVWCVKPPRFVVYRRLLEKQPKGTPFLCGEGDIFR